MFAASEYEITGTTDVTQILAWAKENCAGRSYTVYAVVDDVPTDRGIVHVFGVDPTRNR